MMLAEAYRRMSPPEFEKALEQLSTAISLNPQESRAWYMRGEIFFHQREFANAKEALYFALDLAPDHFLTLYHLGVIAFAQSNESEAIRYLEAAVKLYADDQDAWQYLAYSYLRQKDYEHALDSARRGLECDIPTLGLRHVEIVSLRSLHRTDESRPIMDQLLEEHPGHPDMLMENIEQLAAAGQMQAAINFASQIVSQVPEEHPRYQAFAAKLDMLQTTTGLIEEWLDAELTSADDRAHHAAALACDAYWQQVWGDDEASKAQLIKAIKAHAALMLEIEAGAKIARSPLSISFQKISDVLTGYRYMLGYFAFLKLNKMITGDEPSTRITQARALGLWLSGDPSLPKERLMDWSEIGVELPETREGLLKLAAEIVQSALDDGFDEYERLSSQEFQQIGESEFGSAIWQDLRRNGLIK